MDTTKEFGKVNKWLPVSSEADLFDRIVAMITNLDIDIEKQIALFDLYRAVSITRRRFEEIERGKSL